MACLSNRAPGKAEVGTTNFPFQGEAGFGIAVRIVHHPGKFYLECYGPCYSLNGEIAMQLKFIIVLFLGSRTFENKVWKMFRIKKVGRFQMPVTLLIVRSDGGRFGRKSGFQSGKPVIIGLHGGRIAGKFTRNGGNHQVFHFKPDVAVGWVYYPS